MINTVGKMSDYINENPAKAYFDGMLWAAFGTNLLRVMVTEWQIDAVKECASLIKEAEIEHSLASNDEKGELKKQWKVYLETYTQGFKDELRREGKLLNMSR